jgi:lipopolysaccharide export system protein LptA
MKIIMPILMCFLLIATISPAADKNKSGTEQATEPIHIVSDQLISDSESKFAEFIGNVKATQADTVIISDRLKVVYSKSSEFGTALSAESDSVEKIIATGNVKIEFENKVAYSQEAVYDTRTQTVTLIGDDSKVYSGPNFIAGAKIVMYRPDGRIRVESSSNKRVEALFHSEPEDKPTNQEKSN